MGTIAPPEYTGVATQQDPPERNLGTSEPEVRLDEQHYRKNWPEAYRVSRYLGAELGVHIDTQHLRAFLTAVAEHAESGRNCHPDDYDIQGEGVRALRQGWERDAACRFLDDADLMVRASTLIHSDERLLAVSLEVCPVNGIAEANAATDDPHEALAIYTRNMHRAMRHAAHGLRMRPPARALCPTVRRTGARARGAGRPRAAASRSSSRSGDSGSDDSDESGDGESLARARIAAEVPPNTGSGQHRKTEAQLRGYGPQGFRQRRVLIDARRPRPDALIGRLIARAGEAGIALDARQARAWISRFGRSDALAALDRLIAEARRTATATASKRGVA